MVGNVILQCEDVANLTIVALGPQVTPRQTVDKLRIDPHALASPLNTALEHIAHPEILGYLLHLHRLALVCESRVAGDDKKV
jgi:hypothetical protein